ncbi:MAG: FG-GAP-like repeat-containing protein [Saprospiraceae bacterium]
MTRFFCLILVLFIISCASDSEQQDGADNLVDQNNAKDGTAQMIQLLQEAHAAIDPMKVAYHQNSVRAELVKGKLTASTDLNQQIATRGNYGNELLLAGKTHEAIVEIEKLMETLRKNNAPTSSINHVNRLLAIAYMRLGEQENCLGQNNKASCIVPIQGDGIYDLKRGPETAISIYKNILKTDPEDMETVWMLNIAYMTLGEYPNGVPAKYRIPVSAFQSNNKSAPFQNISNELQLATVAQAGGSCIEDFNNDGLLDVMASAWGVDAQVRFFINKGDGTFEDRTTKTGLTGLTGGLNMQHADYNNDGYNDVLILRGGWYMDQGRIPNSLLENNGDGTFRDVTIEQGLLSKFPTQTATWCDFNNDGWLDLFIGNESGSKIDAPCELYISDKGKFRNVANEVGLGNIRGVVKGCTSGDVNNDGFQDLYISIMGKPNALMMNKGLSPETNLPIFGDFTAQTGVGMPLTSFPTWMWDYNNDGKLDIFAGSYNLMEPKVAANMASFHLGKQPNPSKIHIYENKGNGTFEEVSAKMGITDPAYVMGSNFGDIDNDGSLDFYLGTGAPNYSAVVPNKMYRGKNGVAFEDITASARLGHLQKGHSISFGDIDNDGDQDIFNVLGGAFEGDVFKNAFFENTNSNDNNWITILAEGTTANRSAIGTIIKLICSDEKGNQYVFYHRVSTGGSFGSSSLQQEIGIGKATKIDKLIIRWPNATRSVEEHLGIQSNSFIKVKEGSEKVEYLKRKKIKFNS